MLCLSFAILAKIDTNERLYPANPSQDRSAKLTTKRTPIQKNENSIIVTRHASDWLPNWSIKPHQLSNFLFRLLHIPKNFTITLQPNTPQNSKETRYNNKVSYFLNKELKTTSPNKEPSLFRAPLIPKETLHQFQRKFVDLHSTTNDLDSLDAHGEHYCRNKN